jgi:O-Antigen ligase
MPLTLLIERIALVAMLLVTPALLNARALADIFFSVTAILFLVQCARTGRWSWLRQGWVPFAGAWWIWEMICSLPLPHPFHGTWPNFVQALVMLRYGVFAAALEHWLLRDPRPRLWLRWVVQAVIAYIYAGVLYQYAMGKNFYGYGRWADGELTGPFYKPRAAPELVRILFPAVLPPVMTLIARKSFLAKAAGVALGAIGIACMVLISQRMPVLLTILGLAVSALLLPKLRPVAIGLFIVGGLVIAASPAISPQTYYRLVEKFSMQMDHFRSSPYGLLLRRADEITEQDPIFGRGFNGFRDGCSEQRYWVGWTKQPGDDGGGLSTCKQHPHNFYLQASTDGGYPGLILFSLMVLAWMRELGRGLWRNPNAVRVGIFAAALIHLWPIASTSAFLSLPVSGYFFVILGWGLAETRWRETAPARDAGRVPTPAE